MKNNFIGGMSSKLTPFYVAKKWKISPVEFIPILEKGTEHEMEHTDDKDIARRIALDHIVERLDYYDQLDKIEKMKKGAVLEKPEIFNDITLYYEKKGNWLFDKGNFYAWLYDEKGAGAKLEKQEYDFIMFPPMGKGNPFSDKYVPPLKMIWDKTYQKKFKGINHLLGIVKGFYDEDKNQIIIEMMTTNPKFRRQGINAHIIKNLREVFEVTQDDVIFDKPTKEGKLFESSKKYENGGLIAPNGEQSNLTPELYQVVRTKAFKNWFGDWENDPENASKVLDKNGEPKIVYHGTNNDFTIFDKNKLGEKNFFAESASLGFFFAGNIKTSEAYIGMNSMDWAGVQFGAYDDIINKYKPELDSINKDIEQIYEKYRKQEKDNIKKLQDEIIEKIRETYKDFSENDSKNIFLRDINWEEINRLAQEENNLNGNTQKLKELNDKIKSEIEAKWKIKTNANPRIISLFLNIRNPYIIDYANNKQTDLSQDIKTAIKNTNDGVIFNNLNDGDGVDDIFVVFDSEQIKLADGTNTTFDKNNPDIRFAKGGDTNRNFNDKELLKRYNDGESIGFTAIAHLKAQGLIKRSDGTKRKSKGIFKQGGLIAPNGEQSNLTSEQWDLVRTPEFKGWFGFWDLYPSGKANDYYEPSVRTIAKELKQEKASAIKEVVDFLSKQVTEEDVLIPMPSRYGFATDTQKLAQKISEKTGAKVFDCLVGKKRESIYELKKTNQDVSDFQFDFQINCEIPKARNYFIVDNVIGTGVTMKNALTNVIARVGNNVSPLVYAIDLNNISKVVDENGEPLLVYHGTRDGRFNVFDKEKFGQRTQNENSIAFFFTPDTWYAEAYSESRNNQRIKEYEEIFGEKPNAIEPRPYAEEKVCFLNIKIPKYVNSQRKEDIILAQKEFYDGIILKFKDRNAIFELAVFEPNQIKLADGTNTTFDVNNPDIRFDDGGLIAPNGNESNLTPEQYKLVRTKAFKNWFGDWENDPENSSKVVDENGEPLVVHHGSIIDTKFDIFDYKKADLGFHFGTKEQAKKRVESKSVLPPRKSIVNSFFLNIKVLFEMTDVGEWQYPQRYIDELMSDNIIEEKVAKQKGFLSLYRREDNAIIRDYIKSKYGSFVGFVYNNKYEGNGKSFIALSPEQIKLADGTNTTFDGNNSNIRFAKGGLIAPNGNESNLTPEQYKLVRTKAFKDWFGDWENDPENASKVVDKNGEPLVVYHGTKYTEEFYQFDLEAISDENVKAFFFSKGYEHAKRYTFSTGSVKAFFLKAIKLFDPKSLSMSESKKIRSILNESVVEDFIEYNYLDGLEEWKSKYDSNMSDEDFLFYILTNTDSSWGVVELQVFQDYLKSKNYDGFITYEQVTNESIPNINYAVFESNQIKLADGTNTTFDGNNLDIRFAKGGLIAPNGNESNLTPEQYKLVRTKAFKNWFGDWENDPENSSKVVDDNGEPLVMYHGTAFGEFNEFDLNRIGRNYEQSFGFYFTNIKNKNTGYSAQEYANRKFISKKPYVFEVFLNIKNPILQEVFSERPAQAIDWERNELKAELRKGLKDGVIAESRWQKIKEVIAVTLNSEQIKLADGTNTTFDGKNPDIRFAKGGLIAPNGNESNLTPEQYKLVRTKAFKDWFGDWENDPKNASKIVDENGEPNMCFHGTKNDFFEFSERYIASANDSGFYGKGFYFTFQKEFKDIKYAISEASYYGNKILNCYIKAINPFNFSILSIYKNKHINYIGAESLVFLTNIANLFPQISNQIYIEKNTWNKLTEEYDVDKVPISILPNLVNKYANDLKLIETTGQFDAKETMGYVKSEIVKYDYTDKGGTKGEYESFDDLGRVQFEISKEEKEIIFIEKAIEKYEGISFRFQPEGYMTRNSIITDAIKKDHDCILQTKYGDELVVFNTNQIKLADGSNTTFDGGNPDIRFNKGGEIENLIDQGEIELKVYPTTPEHANLYGLKSENPLYIESIFISENQRLKGIGKKVLEYLNDFALKNGHDVMFGHITQKASFSKDDSRQSDLDDVDMIKYWLQSNGYETCEGNNDFYKVMNKPNIIFEDGGINLSNKELMAHDFFNEQKELQRNSKYAILLDALFSNYTNEMREVYTNLEDELIDKLGYNPLINYRPFHSGIYKDRGNVILMFDDDSNLLGLLEFTIESKYTIVPRYSPDYIKPEPIFENNDNVFYIEYIFSFSKGNGQKMMNRIKKYADQYNVDIGLEGSIIEGTDGKPIASAKHLRRFYDKQGFINVKGHYFLYTPNSMEKGGEVTTENKIYEITRHYFGSLNASSMGGYFNVEGVSLRIKNHLANWNNFYEYHLKNIDENSNPYFLSVVIGSDNPYREQDKADINTEEFVNDHIEENTNLKAEEIVFDFSDTIEDIIYTIDKKMKKMTSMAKGGKTISQTPAPASDRVSGSKTNPKGSASDTSLAKSIKFNDSLLKAIENKVKAHNEEYPSKKVTTPTAKAVVRRGMGAYSKSHRPFITGGAPNSRQAWGLARLNKFLLKKRGVKVKSAYIQDDDLL